MLEVLNGNQINLKAVSDTDLRLKGQIILKNSVKTHSIVYKMKSTNPRLFDADPVKNIIAPGLTSRITITTTQPISPDAAREISQKNKFLIEYLILQKKISDLQEGLVLLRGPGVQQIKLFMNTSSVRTSKGPKNYKEGSVVNSNRFSFHSMAPNIYEPETNLNPINEADKLERLKNEVNFLEKKRQNFLKEASREIKKGKGSSLKYILVLLLGTVVGNMAGKYSGLQEYVSNQVSAPPKQQEQIEQGYLSIFNFGNSQEEVVVIEEEKPWWKFW